MCMCMCMFTDGHMHGVSKCVCLDSMTDKKAGALMSMCICGHVLGQGQGQGQGRGRAYVQLRITSTRAETHFEGVISVGRGPIGVISVGRGRGKGKAAF